MITFDLSMFIFMSYFFPTSTILFSINCSPPSVLEITTRSSAYFMVLIFLPPSVKSLMFSIVSLTSHSPYRLNRIGDMGHPWRTLLPISTLLVSP
uniref:Putative product n=1 Tax=Xenopsylla cheopis TaxID=163159 RepID=A0A6M2DZR2_XENCH